MTHTEREAREQVKVWKQRKREARKDARTYEKFYVLALRDLRKILEQERRWKDMQQP